MKSQSVSDWLFYGFSLHPQNLAEVFGFFAVMFIVILAFYFFGAVNIMGILLVVSMGSEYIFNCSLNLTVGYITDRIDVATHFIG
ncbi:hypothetical protein SAMN05444724_0194 [Salinivibrio sp. ES.052]|nr:hypothetical protein SAMN05444724_0194 [Salinivibrio sp. ES.052]